MKTWELFTICCALVSRECSATAQHDSSGGAVPPAQIEAFKAHALVTGRLVAELARQQLKLLSGMTGTVIGGDLIADTPIGEITRYNLGGSHALSLYSGGEQTNLQQSNIQLSTIAPSTIQPEKKPAVVGVSNTQPVYNTPVVVGGINVHKPISVKISPVLNRTALFPHAKRIHEEDNLDISWSLEAKPTTTTTTRHPLDITEEASSSEEYLLDGDQYIKVRKTTPAPWHVNPLAVDPFHGAPAAAVAPLEAPPTPDPLDPVMYPVIIPDGGQQNPPAAVEEVKTVYNPLKAIAKIGTNGHW